jgi:DNA-binding MarR family transcriptional regulator
MLRPAERVIGFHRGTRGAAARKLLEQVSMNAHFFGTKRAFHAVLRILRKPLESFGLTAARYDMLYAINGRVPKGLEPSHRIAEQSELPDALGVHKSVVSRMLRSLEQLGLVTRERGVGDRRHLRVELTDAGVARLRDAARCLARASQRLLCMAICFGRRRNPYERFRHLDAYESYLMAIRMKYGDSSWLKYPWHADDEFEWRRGHGEPLLYTGEHD